MASLAPTSVLPVVPRRLSLADRWALVGVPARSRAGALAGGGDVRAECSCRR